MEEGDGRRAPTGAREGWWPDPPWGQAEGRGCVRDASEGHRPHMPGLPPLGTRNLCAVSQVRLRFLQLSVKNPCDERHTPSSRGRGLGAPTSVNADARLRRRQVLGVSRGASGESSVLWPGPDSLSALCRPCRCSRLHANLVLSCSVRDIASPWQGPRCYLHKILGLPPQLPRVHTRQHISIDY